jgi:N-acetylglucosamine-6-phosphate deacetylase
MESGDVMGNAGNQGFFDLQINGYAGVDFQKDDLSADDLHFACERLLADGTSMFLATIITEHVDVMARRLRRIVELRTRDPLARQMIRGLHIEGPFISPLDGFRGAHPKDAVRPADRDAMLELIDAAGGLARIVTLAPEHDADCAVIRLVAGMGIRVSAGHTNASLEQLERAIDAGLSMFTHLGNGCPMQMHRSDNIIQRALSLSDRIRPMFIADGAHVAFPALGNYLRSAGVDRAIVVTDAVAPAGRGPGRFQLGRWDLVIGDDLVARAPDGSHLVGSALSMPNAFQRLVEYVGLSRQQAQRLTIHNPREVLGEPCGCDDCAGVNAGAAGAAAAGSGAAVEVAIARRARAGRPTPERSNGKHSNGEIKVPGVS